MTKQTKLSKIAQLNADASHVGLYIDTYSPGDSMIRYRFFTKPADYFSGDGIYTALGYKEASIFLAGYVNGYSRAKEVF